MQNVRNIAGKLALKAEEIAYIVYRNDDLGIGGRRRRGKSNFVSEKLVFKRS